MSSRKAPYPGAPRVRDEIHTDARLYVSMYSHKLRRARARVGGEVARTPGKKTELAPEPHFPEVVCSIFNFFARALPGAWENGRRARSDASRTPGVDKI